MNLDEILQFKKEQDAREDFIDIQKIVEENSKRYQFKRNVSQWLSDFILNSLDYSLVNDFDYIPVSYNNYKTNKITFKIPGKVLLDYFGFDILLLANASPRAIKTLRFKNDKNEIPDLTANSVLNPLSKMTYNFQTVYEFKWEFYEAHLMTHGLLGLTIVDCTPLPGKGFNLEALKDKALKGKSLCPTLLYPDHEYAISYIDIREIKSVFVISEQSEAFSDEINRTRKPIQKAIDIYEKIIMPSVSNEDVIRERVNTSVALKFDAKTQNFV